MKDKYVLSETVNMENVEQSKFDNDSNRFSMGDVREAFKLLKCGIGVDGIQSDHLDSWRLGLD